MAVRALAQQSCPSRALGAERAGPNLPVIHRGSALGLRPGRQELQGQSPSLSGQELGNPQPRRPLLCPATPEPMRGWAVNGHGQALTPSHSGSTILVPMHPHQGAGERCHEQTSRRTPTMGTSGGLGGQARAAGSLWELCPRDFRRSCGHHAPGLGGAWEPRGLLGSGHRSRPLAGSEDGPSGERGQMGTTAYLPLTLASPGQESSGQASCPHPWPGPITVPHGAGRGRGWPNGDQERSKKRENESGWGGLQGMRVWSPLLTIGPGDPGGRDWPTGVPAEEPHLHSPFPRPLQPPQKCLPPTTPTCSP